ncbi:MAG: hypothetical protein G4A98_02930 [Buchnera aphidicola (Microlophium carnosum)]|uniref:Uncharacterized protein n=1 Tax=Buchnera aphidicola (Microlophium carnosum) TaxID=2708354 RepID=A0A6G9JV92_9GAMM|nr:MAG: hypothetical protein G4A98_02930 [Buchnera aphidicola (Microlophium carnosum)]
MSSNFLFNLDVVNKKYPSKIDIYKDVIKTVSKIKEDINKFKTINAHNQNSKQLNNFEDRTKLINLENSYNNSLILLNIMKKNIEKNILKKYNNTEEESQIEQNIIRKNNDKTAQNTFMKKKFLNNSYQIFSIIK